MYISKYSPIQYKNGEILNPDGINENILYCKKSIAQKADQEVCRWTNTFTLNQNINTAITSVSSIAYREVLIAPTNNFRRLDGSGVDIILESVAINCYYTATTPFTLTINTNPTDTITFPARDASLSNVPFDIVKLCGNLLSNETTLLLSGLAAGTSITKMDITCGYSSNKYLCGDLTNSGITNTTKPDYNNIIYNYEMDNSTPLNANVFAQIQTDYNTLSTDAVKGTPTRWSMAEFSSITSTTGLAFRLKPIPTWEKPSFSVLETSANVIGFFISYYAISTTASSALSYGWADNNGNFITNYSSSVGTLVNNNETNAGFLVSAANMVRYSDAANDKTKDRYFKIEFTGPGTIQKANVFMILQ